MQRLLVVSGGCWWQAEVVCGKQRLLVASGGCWWHAEVVGVKRRLLVACRGCWWQAEVVGGKRRLLVASGGCRWQTVVGDKQRLLAKSRHCCWQDEVVGSSFSLRSTPFSKPNISSNLGVSRFKERPSTGLWIVQRAARSLQLFSAKVHGKVSPLLQKKGPQMNQFWPRSGIIISNSISYSESPYTYLSKAPNFMAIASKLIELFKAKVERKS